MERIRAEQESARESPDCAPRRYARARPLRGLSGSASEKGVVRTALRQMMRPTGAHTAQETVGLARAQAHANPVKLTLEVRILEAQRVLGPPFSKPVRSTRTDSNRIESNRIESNRIESNWFAQAGRKSGHVSPQCCGSRRGFCGHVLRVLERSELRSR